MLPPDGRTKLEDPELGRRRTEIEGATKMRKLFAGSILVLAAAMAALPVAMAQATQPTQNGALTNTVYNKLNAGTGGAAPKRDLSGSWAGPVQVDAQTKTSLMTPLGQKTFAANKPEPKYHIAGTNDTFARMCDPLGFPRNMVFELRGLSFATMPDRMVVLSQYQRAWREIWTDGRTLPTNVGGTDKGALDPRYYGYSVGHWENDNTFVVDTTGLDERTWLQRSGFPHSINAHVQERYTRADHNDLHLSVTVDDPVMYTKPFTLGEADFKWVPNQQLDEQLCIPSEMLQYLNLIGDPAGTGVPADK